jgi:hypothetical protein
MGQKETPVCRVRVECPVVAVRQCIFPANTPAWRQAMRRLAQFLPILLTSRRESHCLVHPYTQVGQAQDMEPAARTLLDIGTGRVALAHPRCARARI